MDIKKVSAKYIIITFILDIVASLLVGSVLGFILYAINPGFIGSGQLATANPPVWLAIVGSLIGYTVTFLAVGLYLVKKTTADARDNALFYAGLMFVISILSVLLSNTNTEMIMGVVSAVVAPFVVLVSLHFFKRSTKVTS